MVEGRRSRTFLMLPRIFTAILLVLLALMIVSLVARFQRGLLGIALVISLGLLAFYWLRELRKAITARRYVEKYPVEIIEKDGMILLTAQVPGPENEVTVELRGDKLLVRGGKGFRRVVKLPYRASIVNRSYLNGVLHLQLRRE